MYLIEKCCCTCLSEDRNLKPISLFTSLLKEVDIKIKESRSGICWECQSLLRKFAKFKCQVQTAQNIIYQKLPYIQALSNLKCTYVYESDTNKFDEFDIKHIKLEPEDEIGNAVKITKTSDPENIDKDSKINSKDTIECEINSSDVKIENIDSIIIDNNAFDVEINEAIDNESFNEMINNDPIDIKIDNVDDNVIAIKFEADTESQSSVIEINEDNEIKLRNENLLHKYKNDLKKNDPAKPFSYQQNIIKTQVQRRKERVKHEIKCVEEEFQKKFTNIVLTEEEMLKSREDKRNHPNFKKIPYKCDSCVLGFLKKENYDMHLRKNHDESIGVHVCPVCDVRFLNVRSMEWHRKRHYSLFRCKLCKYETAEMITAVKHGRMKHKLDTAGSIHCRQCDSVFITPEELDSHISQNHAIACDECGMQFKTKNTLRSHKVFSSIMEKNTDDSQDERNRKRNIDDTSDDENKKREERLQKGREKSKRYREKKKYEVTALSTGAAHYSSDSISSKRKKERQKQNSKRRIHKTKREYCCDICKKTFKRKSRLESHMIGHEATLEEKLSYCSVCDIQYKSIHTYRSHLRSSAKHVDTVYTCPKCDKKFASKGNWNRHYNFYHLRKSMNKCNICNELFISSWSLKIHRQKHHGLSRSREHRCHVCGKEFFTKTTLRGHLLIHSEQRTYMCELCGDTFRQSASLYTHTRLVHRGRKKIKTK